MADKEGAPKSEKMGVDDYPELTPEQLVSALAGNGANLRCKSCDADSWYYTRTENGDLKPLIMTSYDQTEFAGGLSLYQRACFKCGWVETFSRAIIKANWRNLGGGE